VNVKHLYQDAQYSDKDLLQNAFYTWKKYILQIILVERSACVYCLYHSFCDLM